MARPPIGTLSQLKTLREKHVHVKNASIVLEKINKIIDDGVNKLQFVTDFDLTVTKQHVNGIRTLYSNDLLIECESLPESCKLKELELTKKYTPIEKDPNIPLEEKKVAMNQWYLDSHQNLNNVRFNCKDLDVVIKKYNYLLRDGTQELFTKLKNLNVPTLVFSAGLGDVVEAMLRNQEILFNNVKIISNFLNIEGDTLKGYKNTDRIITVFNKNEHAVEHEYSDIFESRTNAILMGDSLHDAKMVDVKTAETVLKIGFLYDFDPECLSLYKDTFDIVLVDDQTMDVVLEILSLFTL